MKVLAPVLPKRVRLGQTYVVGRNGPPGREVIVMEPEFVLTADNQMVSVRVLALCESTRLVLRPGELYRFEVVPGCSSCAELAA